MCTNYKLILFHTKGADLDRLWGLSCPSVASISSRNSAEWSINSSCDESSLSSSYLDPSPPPSTPMRGWTRRWAAAALRRCGTPITCYGCHCSVNELLLASASKMSPPAENLFRSNFRPGECPCGSPSHRLSIAPTKVGGTQWEEVFARW